jgi:hypothetical protein
LSDGPGTWPGSVSGGFVSGERTDDSDDERAADDQPASTVLAGACVGNNAEGHAGARHHDATMASIKVRVNRNRAYVSDLPLPRDRWKTVVVTVRQIACVASLATVLALSGCGGSSDHARTRLRTTAALPGPCSPLARTALANALRISPSAVTARPFTPPSGVAACRFAARGLDIVATLDSAPQVYYRFERTTVEYAQNVVWGHLGVGAELVDIPHIGLDADWIPPHHELITTDGVRLITVTVVSVRPRSKPSRTVAAAIARTYLGPPHDPYPA